LSTRKLPDYNLKQKILYIDNTSPEILLNYGNLFLEEGGISDALDFYEKAKHHEGMQKIKDIAYDTGDVMLFQRAAKALNLELNNSDWENIGQKAVTLKKYSFAQHALKKAENQEALDSLKKIMEAEKHGKSA
jgi:tetratricopeptide (TPR) repeat protein